MVPAWRPQSTTVAAMDDALGVVTRPRSTLTRLAASPPLARGAAVVGVSGLLSAGIGVATASLDGSGLSGVVASAVTPVLFLAYWLIQAFLVDAGAGLLGRAGRRARFLAVSGHVFLPWIGYSLLALVEAAVAHSGAGVSAGLAWLTLPALLWFLALTVLAVRAVYDLPVVNSFALALLPYATVTAALLILTAAAGIIRGV